MLLLRAIPPMYDQRLGCMSAGIEGIRLLVVNTQMDKDAGSRMVRHRLLIVSFSRPWRDLPSSTNAYPALDHSRGKSRPSAPRTGLFSVAP
jgi:hypothetical protein